MKKIIFSSVCAVALLSVNANASWDAMNTKTEDAITAALNKLAEKSSSANAWASAVEAYDNAVEIRELAQSKVDAGTKRDEAASIVGADVASSAETLAQVKTLKELSHYYSKDGAGADKTTPDTPKDDTFKTTVDGYITKMTLNTADTIALTPDDAKKLPKVIVEAINKYNLAIAALGADKTKEVGNQDGSSVGSLNEALKDAKADEATKKADADTLETRVNEEAAKNGGAALKTELDGLIKASEAIEKAQEEYLKHTVLSSAIGRNDKDNPTGYYLDVKNAKDALGTPADKSDALTAYGKLAKANEDFAAQVKLNGKSTDKASNAVDATLNAKLNYEKDKILGSTISGNLTSSEMTTGITSVTELNKIHKYFEQISVGTDPVNGVQPAEAKQRAEAVKIVIDAVKEGKKIPKDESGNITLSDKTTTVAWADIKGGVSETALETAVTNLADGEAKVAKDGQLTAGITSAKEDLEAKQEALKDANDTLSNALADLAKIQADLTAAKAETIVAKENIKTIEKNIGSDLAYAAGGSVKLLAGALIENDGSVKTVKEIKDAASAKGASEEAKARLNEIQAAANAVAGAALEGKKEAVMGSSLGAMNVQINNMNKRLGEIRGLNGEVGTWFRAYGGRYSTDNDHFNYYSTQIGADKITNMGNGDLIVGALFGFDKVNADTSSKTYSLGGYLSYIDNDGFFADTVLKFGKTKHSKDGYSIKSQNIFLASVEGGYRFNIDDSLYVEPSLELITGRIGKYEAKTNNVTIGVDSFTPFVIKPQAFVGYSVNDFILRVGGGYVYNTKRQDATLRINEIVKDLSADAKVKLDKNNYGFASIGGSYKFNDNLRLNLGVERSFGGKLTQDYELNATIRYTF